MSTFPDSVSPEPGSAPADGGRLIEPVVVPDSHESVEQVLGAAALPEIAAPASSEVDELPGLTGSLEPEQPMFASYMRAEPALVSRIPHLGHMSLLLLLLAFGWFGAGSILLIGVRFHVFGVSQIGQAVTDYRYTLGSQGLQYLFTFIGCILTFPALWRRPFFSGVQWNARGALRHGGKLLLAALVCFVGAMLNGMLMPGPTDAPIDKLFRAPGAAWFLFAFGITLAPFFEELVFRGFLLPALCTAYDWCVEQITGAARKPVDENGNPRWSVGAMVAGSIVASVPFALMHGEQTSYSLGPFVLLVGVSVVLCWIRLGTRSLAASTVVHACYNFMLFSFMLLGTSGFQHMDRL